MNIAKLFLNLLMIIISYLLGLFFTSLIPDLSRSEFILMFFFSSIVFAIFLIPVFARIISRL